jgi:uncharacterized Zn finger protein (UPF0148 family)
MTHRAVRQGDEYYCPVCGLRWDIKDSEPDECRPRTKAIAPPKHVREIVKRNQDRRDEQLLKAEAWRELREWAENGFKDEQRPGRE